MKKSLAILLLLVSCSQTPPPAPNRQATLEALGERIQATKEKDRRKFLTLTTDPIDQCGIAPYWFFAPSDSVFTPACAYHDQAYLANEIAMEGEAVRQAVDYHFLALMLEEVEKEPDVCTKWLMFNQAYLMFFIVRQLGDLWW